MNNAQAQSALGSIETFIESLVQIKQRELDRITEKVSNLEVQVTPEIMLELACVFYHKDYVLTDCKVTSVKVHQVLYTEEECIGFILVVLVEMPDETIDKYYLCPDDIHKLKFIDEE